jgi:hypothetical protein
VSGVNCYPAITRNEALATKRKLGKESDTVANPVSKAR